MKVTEEMLSAICKMTVDNNSRLLINDAFICQFAKADGYMLFSPWKDDVNCPRSERHADVIVYNCSNFKHDDGTLYVYYDKDIGMHSMCLCLKGSDNKVCSMVNAVSVELKEPIVSIVDFVSLLKFKPKNTVKEPYNALGLAVGEFEEHNKHFPNFEYGIDGRLYYEIVDESDYREGDLIPLKSDKRKDVIFYYKLTEDNKQDIANRINASLDKLYNS